MSKDIIKNIAVYGDEIITKEACSICGEHSGTYTYRGKIVCPECIEFIRKRY